MIMIIETNSWGAEGILEAIFQENARGADIEIISTCNAPTIEEAVVIHNNRYAMQA